MTGSFGISRLLSLAWSPKFNPMQTILLGLAIGDPSRTECATPGAEVAFSFNQSRSLDSPLSANNASSKSRAKLETSRRAESSRMTPGFSLPGSPSRISFIVSPVFARQHASKVVAKSSSRKRRIVVEQIRDRKPATKVICRRTGKVSQSKTLTVDRGRKRNTKIVFTLLGCC